MTTLKLILPLLLMAPLAAQTAGTWKLATAPNLPKVIEQATASMNFVVRPIARARLKKTNPAYQQITITRSATEVAIKYDQREPQRMPASGQAVSWTREDGETFQLSARSEGEDLLQSYQAEDGERSNHFHFDPATRTLSVRVTVKSQKLPKPITYTLTYR